MSSDAGEKKDGEKPMEKCPVLRQLEEIEIEAKKFALQSMRASLEYQKLSKARDGLIETQKRQMDEFNYGRRKERARSDPRLMELERYYNQIGEEMVITEELTTKRNKQDFEARKEAIDDEEKRRIDAYFNAYLKAIKMELKQVEQKFRTIETAQQEPKTGPNLEEEAGPSMSSLTDKEVKEDLAALVLDKVEKEPEQDPEKFRYRALFTYCALVLNRDLIYDGNMYRVGEKVTIENEAFGKTPMKITSITDSIITFNSTLDDDTREINAPIKDLIEGRLKVYKVLKTPSSWEAFNISY